MNDEIFENITNFIELQRWKYPFGLNKTTKIEKDLGITGDEAVEFILAFGKKFNVDVSNFMAEEYFDSEGDKILPAIINFFTCKKRNKKKELLLGDLERAVKARRLDDTIIGKT